MKTYNIASNETNCDLSIIIPVRNEAENIEKLLRELSTITSSLERSNEVIIIDDGSTDTTVKKLENCLPQYPELKIIELRANFGQSAALDAGFQAARGEIIITMDGDCQNDPKDIPRLLEKLDEGFDFVSGWRKNRQDTFLLRKLPSRIANYLIRFFSGTRFHDMGCSLKVFKKSTIQEVRLYGEMHRILALLVESLGFKGTEIVVNHRPRTAGKSKYNLLRTYKVILDVFLVRFMQKYRSKPLHFFGGIGLLSLIASMMFIAISAWDKWVGHVSVHRNPLFMIGMFFGIASIQFSLLGLIIEILVRNYYESSSASHYSVKRVLSSNQRATELQMRLSNPLEGMA